MTFTVWLQGGQADDFRYETMIEPPDHIYVWRSPHGWVRVLEEWDEAVEYARVPAVEQFTNERIYYPAGATHG